MKQSLLTMLATAVLVIVATSGCVSSSAGIAVRDSLYGTSTSLCLAAQSAVGDLGGRLVISDCSAGTVVGRIDVEGTQVQIDVTLIRSPAAEPGQGFGELIDVSVRASLAGVEDPDPAWTDRLRQIAEQYLEAVRQRSVRH